jgi:GAF domain-containing protein
MTTTYSESYCKNVIDSLLSQASPSVVEKDPEHILETTLGLLSYFLNLNNGRIFLWDTRTEKLTIRYSHNLTKPQIFAGKYEIDEGITGEVLATRRAALIENVENNPTYKGKVSSISPEPKSEDAYIAVPITFEDYDLGVLAVDCNNTKDGDIEAFGIILKLVADMFANIIHKYELCDLAFSDVA